MASISCPGVPTDRFGSGIFAHGFARVRCDDCGVDFLVAFFCKGHGVCPSCNTRRMAEAAAHLAAPKAAVIARQKPLAARSVATWRAATRQTRTCGLMDCHGLRPRNDGKPTPPRPPRPPSHYLWAALIARIDEVFPLICPHCGGQMRLIALAAT
ncbi:hypothetical protein RA876_13350 [Rhodoferax antarcticus]|nr:hypothetical protein RA876_13350 [Rhodoferax antarcticus]